MEETIEKDEHKHSLSPYSNVEDLIHVRSSLIGVFFVAFFSSLITWALIEYAVIVEDEIDLGYTQKVIVHEIGIDKKPREFADPDAVRNMVVPKEGINKFTDSGMGLSFLYPSTYIETERSYAEGTLVLSDSTSNHLIALVVHDVAETTSIDEFVSVHESQRQTGCYDIIDCIRSENSEFVIVGHRPTIIHIPSEYLAYVRGVGVVYEIIVTESLSRLEEVIDSIDFLDN